MQREYSHSFLKKAAFWVGLYPLENRKNVKTSGLAPTQNNKTSLNEWAHTHSKTKKTWNRVGPHTYALTHPHTHTPTHSHTYTPTHLYPPLPKKISKAIHIASPSFQKNKSFLLPQSFSKEYLYGWKVQNLALAACSKKLDHYVALIKVYHHPDK